MADTTVAQVPFAAHQRARHVEVVLRQQLVEVVAGDAPRNARKFLAHQIGIAVANAAPGRRRFRPSGPPRE